ncbi:MAG: hypothetical protein RLZZ444_1568, partial [Pseudomonadota bacterium]
FRRSGKQTEPGEGIGLAHLRTLVRNLGGNVRLESALGQGATFVIRLPKKGQANQMNMESRQA